MTIKWNPTEWEDGQPGRQGVKRNKLTPEQVSEIRRLGRGNSVKIAELFGVSPRQVRNIVSGQQRKGIK